MDIWGKIKFMSLSVAPEKYKDHTTSIMTNYWSSCFLWRFLVLLFSNYLKSSLKHILPKERKNIFGVWPRRFVLRIIRFVLNEPQLPHHDLKIIKYGCKFETTNHKLQLALMKPIPVFNIRNGNGDPIFQGQYVAGQRTFSANVQSVAWHTTQPNAFWLVRGPGSEMVLRCGESLGNSLSWAYSSWLRWLRPHLVLTGPVKKPSNWALANRAALAPSVLG